MIQFLQPVDDKIVVLGQSCVGKTTFANLLDCHHYYCFDALFPWHQIETFGMSVSKSLEYVKANCIADKFVLDGWHTSDLQGEHMPDSSVYVVYSEYDKIIDQYPRYIKHREEFFPMFEKWYSYNNPEARFFHNRGDFVETSFQDYSEFISCELKNQWY